MLGGGLALAWYGLMTVLLAAKVGSRTVNDLSGYRTAYNFLVALTPREVTRGPTREIIAAAGLVSVLVFGVLAWWHLPRPYLPRGELALEDDEHGSVFVSPRAIERAAEIAAAASPGVSGARALYLDGQLELDVSLNDGADVPALLERTRRAAADSVERHELPRPVVDVRLAGFDRDFRRELG